MEHNFFLVYDRGESKGSSCYRLQSRNGQFIYLKTFGFLEIDDQGIVESFVCINTLVPEAEGKRLINDMKNRYSALINSNLTELECTDVSRHLSAIPLSNYMQMLSKQMMFLLALKGRGTIYKY